LPGFYFPSGIRGRREGKKGYDCHLLSSIEEKPQLHLAILRSERKMGHKGRKSTAATGCRKKKKKKEERHGEPPSALCTSFEVRKERGLRGKEETPGHRVSSET